MPRPAGYSEDIAEQVLDRIAEGEGLTKVCEDENMPTKKQFRHWMSARDDLRDAYARARFAWADHWAERIIEISINPSAAIEGDGKVFVDNAQMMWAKHLTDNLKWMVGKYAPRTYGDKPEEIAPTTPQGQVHRIERIVISPPKPAEGEQAAPLQLAYHRPELPGDLAPQDWSILLQLMELLKRTLPTGDDRPPAEIFAVLKDALLAHFREQAETSSA